jgi:hypothetical protein
VGLFFADPGIDVHRHTLSFTNGPCWVKWCYPLTSRCHWIVPSKRVTALIAGMKPAHKTAQVWNVWPDVVELRSYGLTYKQIATALSGPDMGLLHLVSLSY